MPAPVPAPPPSRVRRAPRPPATSPSQLCQWPVQIKLAPVNAPWFSGADLLIAAADCTAFAYGNFHADFIVAASRSSAAPSSTPWITPASSRRSFPPNDIRSILVARMEVPCCGGLESAVRRALEMSGKDIPLAVSTIATNGDLLEGGR